MAKLHDTTRCPSKRQGVMKARDVMTTPVVTTKPTASVKDVAKLFLQRHISAVPVVDDKGKVVGIISESDLMRRGESGTEWQRPWWLTLMTGEQRLAEDYIKAHATKVADVMTSKVITATPDTPLEEIAGVLEKNGIKRVPVVHNGDLVGIVSRANLVQAMASRGSKLDVPISDAAIRDRLLKHLNTQRWAHTDLLNVTVNDGVVDLWGLAASDAERNAIRVAAENVPGVRAVNERMTVGPLFMDWIRKTGTGERINLAAEPKA
jgi:CBS domain-containing protein